MLGGDRSLMGGSDDMKLGVVTVEIVGILRLYIYVSGTRPRMYIVDYTYTLYILHYLG